jgi:hypothetical protein
LWLLPVIATVCYVGITMLNKYPHIFNYPTEVTESNAPKLYVMTVRMLRIIKLAILFTFTEIILSTYFTAMGIANGLGVWFLPLNLLLFFIPIASIIIRTIKK